MIAHKAIVMCNIEKLLYYFGGGIGGGISSYSTNEIRIRREFVEHKEIWKGELENPPLSVGEYLYIKNLDKKVRVLDKAKSTEGGYIYWTDQHEYIEDEETETTRLEAEKVKKEYEEYFEIRKQQQIKQENKPKEVTKKKWYEFWR